jgi:uncharacterized protein (TIGR02117 family)
MKLQHVMLIVSVAVAACSDKPYAIQPAEVEIGERPHEFFIADHGWHTGLIIPTSDLNTVVPELRDRFGSGSYYEIGWGDKGFYQAKEITSGLALQAMFWSSGTVLHIVAVPNDPRKYFTHSEVVASCLTDEERRSLLQFVSESFERGEAGKLVELERGIYGDSQFYGAEGNYYMLNTCNKWTAKSLESAGFAISPTSKLTAGSIMDYMSRHNRACEVH